MMIVIPILIPSVGFGWICTFLGGKPGDVLLFSAAFPAVATVLMLWMKEPRTRLRRRRRHRHTRGRPLTGRNESMTMTDYRTIVVGTARRWPNTLADAPLGWPATTTPIW